MVTATVCIADLELNCVNGFETMPRVGNSKHNYLTRDGMLDPPHTPTLSAAPAGSCGDSKDSSVDGKAHHQNEREGGEGKRRGLVWFHRAVNRL